MNCLFETITALRGNMDPSLAAMFGDMNKRKDLFNLWLTHARDFGSVRLEVQRRNVSRESCHQNTIAWSKTQLQQSGRYTAEQIDDLITRRTAERRYVDDPNFPGDVSCRKYYVVEEIGAQRQRLQEDVQAISNAGEITNAEALALTNPGQWCFCFRTGVISQLMKTFVVI